jgi:LAO/AO transport system kinase
VGQAEVDIAATADTTVVLLAPGMGDGVQAAKAGLLEVADLLVVNKCDREGADDAVRDLRNMVASGSREAGAWRPLVVRAIGTKDGGVDDLIEAIGTHRDWLASSGEGAQRRLLRAAHEITTLALTMLSARIGLRADDPRVAALAVDVVAGRTDPYAAARELVAIA